MLRPKTILVQLSYSRIDPPYPLEYYQYYQLSCMIQPQVSGLHVNTCGRQVQTMDY